MGFSVSECFSLLASFFKYTSFFRLILSFIPKTLEDARLRKTSEGPEHRWTM